MILLFEVKTDSLPKDLAKLFGPGEGQIKGEYVARVIHSALEDVYGEMTVVFKGYELLTPAG